MAPESIREYNEPMSSFDETEEGSLRIWEGPHRDKKYIVGADVALGVREITQ